MPSLEGAGYLLRRYHGYGFSFLIIHVFWFHPPVATLTHAIGYFHSAMLLVQSSAFYTRLHLNPYWKLLLEVLRGSTASPAGSYTDGALRGRPLTPTPPPPSY